MLINKPVVYPLFPSLLGTYVVNDDIQELDIIKTYRFSVKSNDGSYNSCVSTDFKILDNFPNVKSIIENHFLHFKNKVLKLTNNEFVISSSWATKTEPKGFCQYHTHKNSFYSGIIYWEDLPDAGNLEFENNNGSQFLLDQTEANLHISQKFFVKYQKNLIAFFPSYLSHRIGLNNTIHDRYSVAYNFYPIGVIGNGDSSVSLLVKDF